MGISEIAHDIFSSDSRSNEDRQTALFSLDHKIFMQDREDEGYDDPCNGNDNVFLFPTSSLSGDEQTPLFSLDHYPSLTEERRKMDTSETASEASSPPVQVRKKKKSANKKRPIKKKAQKKSKQASACNHCYRLRVRCDNKRPCGKCVQTKKTDCKDRQPQARVKLTTKRSKRKKTNVVCTSCKTARTACDISRPCARCIRLEKGNDCADRPQTSPTPPPANARKKTNLACASCKTARTACDAHRPCGRCVRLGKGNDCVDREISNNSN